MDDFPELPSRKMPGRGAGGAALCSSAPAEDERALSGLNITGPTGGQWVVDAMVLYSSAPTAGTRWVLFSSAPVRRGGKKQERP